MSSLKNVLIVGGSGLLGRSLLDQAAAQGIQCVHSSSQPKSAPVYLDLRKPESIAAALDAHAPSHVINSSAYTAVDDAERQYSAAFAINAEGAGALARACASRGIRLLHLSTDYVFGGAGRNEPYKEGDAVQPLGIYGLSKWYGELLCQAHAAAQCLIIRTSWLHGAHGPNFIDTMLRLAKSRDHVQVVNDQRGSLTWAPWLAECTLKLAETDAIGVVHASSSGIASWYDVAVELFRQSGLAIAVEPVSTEAFPRPAPRPRFSALNCSKLRTLVDIPEFRWEDSIAAHLAERGAR